MQKLTFYLMWNKFLKNKSQNYSKDVCIMRNNELSFGEEFGLEKENYLGEKDEVALFVCLICGLGSAAGCVLCGCELPILFGAGALAFHELTVGLAADAALTGAFTPV